MLCAVRCSGMQVCAEVERMLRVGCYNVMKIGCNVTWRITIQNPHKHWAGGVFLYILLYS